MFFEETLGNFFCEKNVNFNWVAFLLKITGHPASSPDYPDFVQKTP